MAFTVYFYKLISEPNKLLKVQGTDYIILGTGQYPTAYSCVLKDGCSLIEPIIRISGIQLVGNQRVQPNYCSIPEFKRFYFVRNIIYSNNSIVEIELKCDVLHSFESYINTLEGQLLRTEDSNFYNTAIKDNLTVKDCYTNYTKYNLGSLQQDKAFFDVNPIDREVEVSKYVVHMSYTGGNTTDFYGHQYSDRFSLPSKDSLLCNSSSNYLIPTRHSFMLSVLYNIYSENTLASYVYSIMYFPFILYPTDTEENVQVGQKVLDPYVFTTVDTPVKSFTAPFRCLAKSVYKIGGELHFDNFSINARNYLDLPPYKSYRIHFPFVGLVDIDPYVLFGFDYMYYMYTVDLTTGSFRLDLFGSDEFITDVTSGAYTSGIKQFYTFTGNMASIIPYSTNTSSELDRQKSSNNIDKSLSAVGGALTAVLGAAMMSNPATFLMGAGMVGGGVIGTAGAVMGAVKFDDFNKPTNINCKSSNISLLDYCDPMSIYLLVEECEALECDVHTYGKPSMSKVKISDLANNTFSRFSEIHMETTSKDVNTPTNNELDEIYAILKSGFIK